MYPKRIILLDLNYTLVSNQAETRLLRPFSARMEAEEYRTELLDQIKNDYVIIITARPESQKKETLLNLFRKTGWQPQEAYFNDLNAEPPVIKESILQRFVFPKHGEESTQYLALESNPKTRDMYADHGILAIPYAEFLEENKQAGDSQ
jgi:hypothetical protein